jgi:hypothetical protein
LCAQLNEVEARAETYPETLAFISLVNKLLDLCESSNCGPATDAGAASSYVFQFVRDTVFVNLDRLAFAQRAGMPLRGLTGSPRNLAGARIRTSARSGS